MKPAELRSIRRRLALTQPRMAAKMGISVRQLRRYENGEQRIPTVAANSARWVEYSEAGRR